MIRAFSLIACALCLLADAWGLSQVAPTSTQLLLVYSIQRHGARNVLPKAANLSESDANGGPALLPEGQRQAWNAGTGFLSRYIACSTTNQTCLNAAHTGMYGLYGAPNISFDNYNTLVRSSALDRTVSTALSFLAGLFPAIPANPSPTRFLPSGAQVLPVYTQEESQDFMIRGYTRCPAYDARLAAWFNSAEFRSKEAETAQLRSQIQAADPNLNTSLSAWWNVFDSFDVWRNYHVGDPMPDISNDLFSQVQQLANWLETAKMKSTLTGNLLGGALLADLLNYTNAATQAAQVNLPTYYKLVHVSAHYNLILGVMAALGLDTNLPSENATWLHQIPNYASLMVFELFKLPGSTALQSAPLPSSYAIRLVGQDGPDSAWFTLPLPCAIAGDAADIALGSGACTLDRFVQFVQPLTLPSADAWCAACGNTAVMACQLRNALAAASKCNGAQLG